MDSSKEIEVGHDQEKPIRQKAWAAGENEKARIHGWIFPVCLLIAIQAIILRIDQRPMFFLGDSASYIWTALSGWLPPDRSFIYGYFIRLIAVTSKSLTPLVLAQVLLNCVSSIVMAHLLISYFRVRPWIAFVMALLTSLEPLQLLYTRYVMTETLGLAIFAFYVWLGLHYLANPRIIWLALMHCIATLLIGVRLAFIPTAWICAVLIPFLAFPAVVAKPRLADVKTINRLALHAVMSILLVFVFTTAYKHFHGHLQHKPPGYSYHSGFFAMSFMFPILEANDFPDETMGHKVLTDLQFPLTDRRSRAPNHWMEGGVVAHLQEIEPDLLKADAIAGRAAFHAVMHKPIAFLHLGWETLTDYFDQIYLQSCTKTDLGDVRLDVELQKLLTTHFGYPSDRLSAFDLQAPTGQYFLHSVHWFQILLFLPISWGLLLLAFKKGTQRRGVLLLGLISFLSVSAVIFLVERPTPRYLHTTAWLFFLMAGVGLNRLICCLSKVKNGCV